jgi:hypothetical protein
VIRLALIVLILCLAAPVAAQNGSAPPEPLTLEEMCDPASFANVLRDAADELEQAAPDLQTALAQTLRGLHAMQAACSDLMFSGIGNDFVGPFDLPAGDYRVDAFFSGIATAPLSSLTGECGLDFAGKILASLIQDGGRDSLLLRTDQECRVVVEVNTDDVWFLTFAPVQ